jgi:hypothetical protein
MIRLNAQQKANILFLFKKKPRKDKYKSQGDDVRKTCDM